MLPLALVTGASGFVGSHLVEELLDSGWRVRCLVRATSSLQWLPSGRVELARGDVTDAAALGDAVRGVAIVFHLAGVTSASRADDYRRVNVYGTRLVCDAITTRNPDAPVVLCSSLAAAGPALEGRPLTEADPARPITAYGASKLEAERVLEASGVFHAIVRPPAVYGPRDRDVLAAFRLAARGIAVRVGPRDQWLSMIYVADLVRGLLGAATHGVGRGTYYVSGGQYPWDEIVRNIGVAVDCPVRVVRVPRPIVYAAALADRAAARVTGSKPLLTPDRVRDLAQHDWRCDDTRARRELDYTPAVSLADGMQRTAQWYREEGWL